MKILTGTERWQQWRFWWSWTWSSLGRRGGNNGFDNHDYDDRLDGDVAIMILMMTTKIITWTERWQSWWFWRSWFDDYLAIMMRATIMLLMMTIMTMMITWTERWQDFSGRALPRSYSQPTFNEMMIMPTIVMMMMVMILYDRAWVWEDYWRRKKNDHRLRLSW